MENTMSHCGIDCSKCPVYVATSIGDTDEKVRMCINNRGIYLDSTVNMIECYGCRADSSSQSPLCKGCSIRRVARKKSRPR